MKFSIKDFFSKCGEVRSFLQIWSHLLKKSLMENFVFVHCCYYNDLESNVQFYNNYYNSIILFNITILTENNKNLQKRTFAAYEIL